MTRGLMMTQSIEVLDEKIDKRLARLKKHEDIITPSNTTLKPSCFIII